MRRLAPLLLIGLFPLTGCIGPVALHQAVLGYDESISRLDREMLLLNIARKHRNLPGHFTVTSSIAATFDFRTQAGITGALRFPGSDSLGLSLGASVSENPTLSIIPIQGEEFTRRVLTPMEASKFEFLLIQGAPFDMVARLMARGIEVRNKDGTFQRFILNSPARPKEYEEFRRRTLHMAWLNTSRNLFIGRMTFQESLRARLRAPPSARDLLSAREKGYRWRRVGDDGTYELTRKAVGRVVVTNYDPGLLSDKERAALNAVAASRPESFILVDIRPGYPGGDYPLFGAIKLRSFNLILQFLGDEVGRVSEFDVKKDPRTASAGRNPRRTLAVEVRNESRRPSNPREVFFQGRYYRVGDTLWDRQAFVLLYQLFQMTLTDVSGVAAPSITIGK